MKLLYAFIFYFFFVATLAAQVTLSLPIVSVKAGDNVVLYPRLTTKDSLSTLQFTLRWDPTILQFVSADSLILPTVSGLDYFGTTDATNGFLRFAWSTPNKPFSTTLDTVKLFRLIFKAAFVNAKSTIAVVDSPVRYQAVNPSLNKLTVKHTDGQVSVIKTTGINDLSGTDNFKLFPIFPNPFSSIITVPYFIGSVGTLRLEVFSIAGEKIFSEEKHGITGYEKQNIYLEGKPTGLYILRACQDNNCFIQKILKE